MRRRPNEAGWQLVGAALLTVWVLAACGLEAGSSAGGAERNAGPAAPPSARTADAGTDRQSAGKIESGEITHIERIVVTPSTRVADGVAVYRVVVRLDDGQSHEFTEPSLGELKVGDRVQVVRSGAPSST